MRANEGGEQMNLRRWLHEHSLKLLAIRDTPEAIAGGIAIGIFFGFTPLFGLKTLSAIFFAWLTGSNILAAVIAGTLHDVILPFMPMIYRWEYSIGYWLLSHPHHWPPSLARMRWEGAAWRHWTTFFSVGKPLLVGGCICAAPVSAISFFVARGIVDRHQRKKAREPAVADEVNPS
jgi:uncharacterized protein